MITINNISGNAVSNYTELYGLSSDTKPVGKYNGDILANGSRFTEIDTGNIYLYSEANGGKWYKSSYAPTTAEVISIISAWFVQHPAVITAVGLDNLPAAGNENTVYIDTSANKIYRWSEGEEKYICVGTDYSNIAIVNGERQ